MIVRLFLQVLLRGFATRNDRLQRNHLVVFDEWHQVHVIVTLDDEDSLTAISLLIRVFKDVQHVPLSDEEHDLLEAEVAVSLQLLVLRVVPGEILHQSECTRMCAFWAHIRRSRIVPPSTVAVARGALVGLVLWISTAA
jgi:hypothetical protein